MTVEEMLSRMSAGELDRWAAFASVEPIGYARLDFWGAKLSALLRAAWFKGRVSPQDCLPEWWGSERKAQTPDEIEMMLLNITRSMGGKVVGYDK